ncbi:Thymidine phosphorylase [Streptomyces tendae]
MTAPTTATDVNQPSLEHAPPTGRRMSWPVLLLVIAGALALTSIVRLITGANGITNVSQMSTALQLAVPIGLAGLGGLWAERAGVVNIGLEGMMILGTWFGAWAGFQWGPWTGVLVGIVGGCLGGLLHAIVTITFNVNHIVSGVAINILALGATRYLAPLACEVTGTVEAIPLIASSIMSKKIAEGTGSLVLDVKVGSGAFMKTIEDARELASTMVGLGTDHGVRTVALLTDMATPLGLTAGNALEVRESVEVLAGGGPSDVVELTLALAREMLDAAGLKDADPAKALADGSAMDVWRRMIAAQGGDPDAALPTSKEQHVVKAASSGVLTRLDAYDIGVAAWRLGAGRARKEDPVQAAAGVELHAKPGDTVTAGQPLLTLHTDTPDRFEYALAAVEGAYDVAPAGTAFTAAPVVRERIA